MKKIEEIRIVGSPIDDIGGNLGFLFLKHIGNYSMDNEINVLVIQTSLIRTLKEILEVMLNDVNTYNLYFIYARISESYYSSLSDYEKIEFTCKCIYKGLLKWAMKFNLPVEPIHVANQKIIKDEYFSEKAKKYTSKNRRYICSIEIRYEYDSTSYRLKFVDNNLKQIERYFICNKKYFKDDELIKNDYMKWLNTPRTLKVAGWANNEFVMMWGDETYIFKIGGKEIIKK